MAGRDARVPRIRSHPSASANGYPVGGPIGRAGHHIAHTAMTSRFCYWSIATGDYADLLTALVASARRAGVREDFHVWTDREVPGAQCHPAGQFDNWGWLFKLVFLRDEVARLDYDYFIFLDADSWFVRAPEDPGRWIEDTPLHIPFGADLTLAPPRALWWEYPVETHIALMRAAGVRHASLYNVNAGLFIVRRDAIETVCALANQYWSFCQRHGVLCVDEPLLAYVSQRLTRFPERHTLAVSHAFWAIDGNGVFADRLPDGQPFRFRGFLGQYDLTLNPAIVHLVRGKSPMFAFARQIQPKPRGSSRFPGTPAVIASVPPPQLLPR